MTLSPFEIALGTRQGRIPKPGAPGAFVIELGHSARIIETFEKHASHTYTQTFALAAGTKLVRARVHILAPRSGFAGAHMESPCFFSGWVFTAGVGSTVYYQRPLPPDGRDLLLHDIAIPTYLASGGSLTVTYRLGLDWFEAS